MKGRALMSLLRLAALRRTPLENQRAAALLMLDPSGLKFWDQLVPVDSLILLTFALVRCDLRLPPSLSRPPPGKDAETQRQESGLLR